MEEIGAFEIAAYRTRKGKKELPENLLRELRLFYDEQEAFAWKPDFMIVSNPTSLHLEFLLKAIDHNIDALIEKPVAGSYKQIRKVEDKILRRKNMVCAGFNLRFHPIIRQVKQILSDGRYGKPLKADLFVGDYLPNWHPYEDYRQSYASRKEMGGGALRTLCHEIDLGQYWLGDYDELFSRVSKISDLDIDVDDNADINAVMRNGTLVNITMDYLNPVLERRGKILFEKGSLEYSFSKMNVTFTDYATRENELLLKVDNYDYNVQYICQMEQFIAKTGGQICTLEEGINVTRIIDKCEESSRMGRVLHVQAG